MRRFMIEHGNKTRLEAEWFKYENLYSPENHPVQIIKKSLANLTNSNYSFTHRLAWGLNELDTLLIG